MLRRWDFLFSLRFGHAQGKTTLSCFLTLSRRYATPSAFVSSPFALVHSARPTRNARHRFGTKRLSTVLCLALPFPSSRRSWKGRESHFQNPKKKELKPPYGDLSSFGCTRGRLKEPYVFYVLLLYKFMKISDIFFHRFELSMFSMQILRAGR